MFSKSFYTTTFISLSLLISSSAYCQDEQANMVIDATEVTEEMAEVTDITSEIIEITDAIKLNLPVLAAADVLNIVPTPEVSEVVEIVEDVVETATSL